MCYCISISGKDFCRNINCFFGVDIMKKIISLIFALLTLFACTVPAMASKTLDVDKSMVVNSDEEYSRVAVKRGTILIIPKDTTANMNGSLIVTGTLMIQGKMTGEVSTYSNGETGKIILSDKGSAFLSFSSEEDAEKFASTVDNADVFINGCSVKVLPCFHAHTSEQIVNAVVCGKCGEVMSYKASNTASALSQGCPEIVFGIGGLAVGFLAAMFIFRKKKVVVNSTSEEDEE